MEKSSARHRSENLPRDLFLVVKGFIKNDLYSPEKFSPLHFPNIQTLVLELSHEILKDSPELGTLLHRDDNCDQIKRLLLGRLNFMVLLKEYPQTVVMIYKKYIQKFINYKHSFPEDRADIFQEVITRLLENKIYKIQKKFNHNLQDHNNISIFTSYLMVTVRNIYIDIMRERKVRPLTSGEFCEIDDVQDNEAKDKMFNLLMIKEEFIKLHTILLLFYKSRAKLEICLKLKFRIRLNRETIQNCFPECSPEEIQLLTQDYTLLKDKQLFETILNVFNRNENKINKSDSLRKWINVKIDEIIAHLNRTHGNMVYNNKNFEDFIVLYFKNHECNPVQA